MNNDTLKVCNLPLAEHRWFFYWKETEVMKIGKDIFEDVKKAIGCEYISDIPKRQEEVIETIRDIDLTGYPAEQINAFRRYVFGREK